MHTQFAKRPYLRHLTLALLLAVTLLVPVLSGTGLSAVKEPPNTAQAADNYGKLSLDLAMSTAFADVQNAWNKEELGEGNEKDGTYWTNIKTLTAGEHFGNVGLLLGSKGTSKQSDIWSVLSKHAMDGDMIKLYDTKTGGQSFQKYQVFGNAVQNVNKTALKTRGASSSLDSTLNQVSSVAGKIANLGTTILKDYNPAPLLLSMTDSSKLSEGTGENKLVDAVMGNTNLREVFMTLGSGVSVGPMTVPLSFLIMAVVAILLFIFSVFLTLINGNSAGQGMRKAVIRVIVGCVAIQLLAICLNGGINFLDTVSINVATAPESNYVEQNLNMRDWAKCGFVIPSGRDIEINEKGHFVFNREDVREINKKVARELGKKTDDVSMMKTMERYYKAQKATGTPAGATLTTPQLANGDGTWRTKKYYETVEIFGEGKDEIDLGNTGYFVFNGLNMTVPSDNDNGTSTVTGSHSRFGISPIAATNLLRTEFDGSGMQVTGGSGLGGVAMDVDNYTSASDAKMPGLVGFIAMFSMVIAAVKGMFTIFGAGFGGILAGGAKSAFGSASGFGQAAGGILAIVGGVFGIGLIMTATYGLLDQFYGLVNSLIDGTGTDQTALMDPIKDVLCATAFTDLLFGSLIKTLGSMVCTLLAIIILPKFAGIPVTMFCQALADLPNTFAQRAQLMENRITGDYHSGIGGRGGGGGMGSAGGMFKQAAGQGAGQTMQALGGMKTAAAAVAGFGLSQLGNKMAEKGEQSMAKADEEAKAANTTPENETPDADGENPDGSVANGENETGDINNNNTVDGPETTDINKEGNNTLSEKETDAENNSESSTDSLSDSREQNSSDQEGAENSTTSEQDSLAENNAEERSDSESTSAERSQSDVSSLSDTQSDNLNVAEDSSMAENTTDSLKEVDQTGFASSHSEKSVNGDKSMASGGDKAKTPGTSSQQAMKPTGAQKGAGLTKPRANAKGTTMTKADGVQKTEKEQLTSAQKKARNTRAFGRALQAAGGHTTGKQALAGMGAGLVHAAGTTVGAGALTQKGVNAVQASKDRARDKREGFAPGTTANQRNARTQQKTQTNQQTVTTTDQSANTQDTARRYEAFLADEAAREND